MLKLASVVNSAASGLMECVENHGGSRRAVLEHSGFKRSDLERSDDRMTVAQFSRLIHEAAVATDCHDISLRFARRYDIRRLGPVGYLLRHADTLGSALEDYGRYFHTLQSQTEIKFEVNGNLAYVGYRVSDRMSYDRRHDAQFSTGIILYLAAQMCGSKWQLRGVEFEHERIKSCAYADLLGTRNVRFEAEANGFYFPATLLDVRNHHADRQLTSILRDFLCSTDAVALKPAPGNPIAGAVVTLIHQRKDTRIEAVASFLGRGVRQIQRDCGKEGTTFSALRAEAIMDVATDLLTSDTIPLTEIAMLVGFSESSAFSRAFKSHAGMSPSQYRTNNRSL